ncbi:hypothetical protein BH11BAC4_BH11BAC4_21430 [soil metagenome]
MKRHEALAPLSREHHGALILAQLLKITTPEYKGLPTSPADKAEYALDFFHKSLHTHFLKEEEMLEKIKNCNELIDSITTEIFDEHEQLKNAFLALADSKSLETDLDRLGENLDKHIRKEERVLFPLVQEHCTGKLLDEIKNVLH